MPLSIKKKRNHFSSVKKLKEEKEIKNAKARARSEKTESELENWFRYRPSNKLVVRNAMQRLVDEAGNEIVKERIDKLNTKTESDESKIQRFEEKQKLDRERDEELTRALKEWFIRDE